MNKGDLTGLILHDLHKAFDIVNHDLLLRKLTQYRGSDNALCWFISYLTDRQQYVQINQNKSESETITSCVPHSSILGPLLFIIYMNDLSLEIEQSELDMYANDSILGAAGGTLDVIEQKLKPDICNIVNWCSDNRMAINYDKTKAISITTCQKLHTLPVKELNITVKGQVLENVKQEKLLGLVVDQNLFWNSHITKVYKTESMLLARFRCIKPFLLTDARIKFCNAFILPHFDYCSTVWGSANLDQLFKLQKIEQHK